MKNLTSEISCATNPASSHKLADETDCLFGYVWDLMVNYDPAPKTGGHDVYRDARWFTHLFSPRRDIYAEPTDLPCYWQGRSTRNTLLTLAVIEKAFNGGRSVGWFSSRSPQVICLKVGGDPFTSIRDIDANAICSTMRADYEATISRFSVPPSVVAQGQHGLYVYYLLQDGIYHETLEAIVSRILGDSPAEFRNTATAAVPVPRRKDLLNPTNLEAARWGLFGGTDWECVPIYQTSQLFGTDWRSRLVVTTRPNIQYISDSPGAKMDSQKENTRRKMPTIEEVETHILPFENDMAQEQLFVAVVACHDYGLDAGQTLQRVLEWIENSPHYAGQTTEMSSDDLDRRIRAIHDIAHLVHWPFSSADSSLPDTEPIVELHPFATESTGAIRRFLTELARWQRLHDQVGDNPDLLAMFNDKYPFYRHHRCLGLYPLPSELLSSWAPDYSRYIEWLIDLGILRDAGLQYNADGICKYYFISFADVHHKNR